jgi:hypothetical protein
VIVCAASSQTLCKVSGVGSVDKSSLGTSVGIGLFSISCFFCKKDFSTFNHVVLGVVDNALSNVVTSGILCNIKK